MSASPIPPSSNPNSGTTELQALLLKRAIADQGKVAISLIEGATSTPQQPSPPRPYEGRGTRVNVVA